MDRNKQLFINMLAQIVVFAVNMGINFFVTPYIVGQLGSEAYGFIGLANNFVNYASLITIALNSMASRFISLSYHRNDLKAANGYFNSLFIADLIMSAVLVVPSAFCVLTIERLINVPNELIFDVKCTFAVVFANFIIGIMTTAFSMAFFVKNKLYINSLRTIESNVIRIIIVLGLFFLFKPSITYMVIGSFAAALFVAVTNIYYNKKLLPELSLKKGQSNLRYIKELISSGIWNVVTKMSQILTSGLDLLVSNLFINASAMGVLALAKTVPNFIVSFITSVSGVFIPDMTIIYAHGDKKEFVRTVKTNIRIMSVFSSLPSVILIVLGTEFFRLWVPSENAGELQILSVLTIVNSCVTGPLQPVYNIFVITNKIHISSKVMLVYGMVSFGITIVFLKFTALGVYAIVGVSLVCSLIVSCCFHIPFGAKIINMRWWEFYPTILRGLSAIPVITAVGYVIKHILNPTSWISLAFNAVLIGLFGLGINMMLVLNKSERQLLISKTMEKFKK